MAKLTNYTDVNFIIGLGKINLEKDYDFSNMQVTYCKAFQGFLKKISNMTVKQVDEEFARRPDKNDMYLGQQVLHYAVNDSFRIHVILLDGIYHLLRLDTNHKVHKC